MSLKIVFPDYPTKVRMTEGRRPVYYGIKDVIPLKYRNQWYYFRAGKLWDSVNKEWIVKNKQSLDKPRYLPLSYNKIGTRQKVPVLIKLKEYMKPFIPKTLNILTPCMIDCTVYDQPIPLHKDLDNMHIYYKAFLDLLVDMGHLKDDSKQFVTQAGGFRYVPVAKTSERQLIFSLKMDMRHSIREHVMYNMSPKKLVRSKRKQGIGIESGKTTLTGWKIPPGEWSFDAPMGETLLLNFGTTKVTSTHADKLFRAMFAFCINNNTPCSVNEEFYRVHKARIQKFLLNEGVQVILTIKDGQQINDGELFSVQ